MSFSETPVRILHLEDSALDAELTLIQLHEDGLPFTLRRVWMRDDFVAALSVDSFDLILADHQLPDFDGDAALEIARDMVPDVPFIFVSGTLGEDVAVEALKRGAVDYVVKQRLDRLPRVVRRALAEARERSERRRAEAELRDRAEELQAVLDAVPAAIWIAEGSDGRVIRGNRASDALLRLDSGSNASLSQANDDRPAHFTVWAGGRQLSPNEMPVQRAAQGAVISGFEEELRFDNGERRTLFGNANPLYGSDGQLRGAVAAFVDITEARQAVERLRESDAKLRLALQAGRLAQVTFHAPAMELSHSPEFATLMGLPGDAQVSFADFQAALHPDDREQVLADQKAILFNPECRIYQAERHVVWPDGTDHWLYGIGRVDRDATGQPTELVAVYSDITDRKLAERTLREVNEDLERIVEERTQALAEGQARISTILESSLVQLGMLRPDGVLLYSNPASLVAIEATASDVIGLPFWETPWFTGTEGLPDQIRALVQLVATGRHVREEIHVALPTGSRILDFGMRPVIGPDDNVIAIIPEAMDITERRQAEEALRQSQKLEAMGQLTGGVAHDFNNLLTPIIGSLDLLQRQGVGTERHKRLIDGALQSAERARTLVHRLLAFARRQPLQPVPVDLAKLVSNMAELIASTSGPRIQVEVQVDDTMPPALADAHQVEMAILNLCVNARDAMADGGRLTISADERAIRSGDVEGLRGGRYVRVSVADSGCGMDEVTLAKAIEPFFSTKGVGKGTGLGLSMVHGLASQLGGALRIASKPGLGTDAVLWLPVSRHAAATADEGEGDNTPIQLAAGTALVVDDELLVRASTCDMLSELGYVVTEAASAEEALELLEAGCHFDLLVTDHLMMGMSGAELARTAASRWGDMDVLLVSGYAEADGVELGIPRLNKPFRQADLAAMLARL